MKQTGHLTIWVAICFLNPFLTQVCNAGAMPVIAGGIKTCLVLRR